MAPELELRIVFFQIRTSAGNLASNAVSEMMETAFVQAPICPFVALLRAQFLGSPLGYTGRGLKLNCCGVQERVPRQRTEANVLLLRTRCADSSPRFAVDFSGG